MRNSWLATTFALFALPLAAWAVVGPKSDPLHAEAEKVFEYDREHPHKLPAHLLRRLSFAVAFQDEEGARKLIASLKR